MSPGYPVYAAHMQMHHSQVPPASEGDKGNGENENQASTSMQQQPQQQQYQHPLFTPGVAMSPYHPYPVASHINPAVGGPVHLPHQPMGSPGGFYFSPMYYPVPSPGGDAGGHVGSGGYFDIPPPPPPQPAGYFPPVLGVVADKREGVEKAIMRTPEDERLAAAAAAATGNTPEGSEAVSSPLSSEKSDFDDEEGSVGSRRMSEAGSSSRATSWHNSDLGNDTEENKDARAHSLVRGERKAGWMGKEHEEVEEAEVAKVSGQLDPGPHPHRSGSY